MTCVIFLMSLLAQAGAQKWFHKSPCIALAIFVDHDNYSHVLDGWGKEMYYYRRYVEMMQNRLDMLGEDILLYLTDLKVVCIYLTRQESDIIFTQRRHYWDPWDAIFPFSEIVKKYHSKAWRNANLVILMTQRLFHSGVEQDLVGGAVKFENICSANRVAVVHHKGIYTTVNNMVQLLLRSLGVKHDGVRGYEECAPRDGQIMSTHVLLLIDYTFSSCTKRNVPIQVARANRNHNDCLVRRKITGSYTKWKPSYGLKNIYYPENVCEHIGMYACDVCYNGRCTDWVEHPARPRPGADTRR
ncbi:uncharacterized protein LOC119458592 isoform X3 [Dermacentor silvarum]|uniref:uncharacterized protein LOC119458592 isoform X3 n=1 Tax=Dermacentor silvarum TaxID=543639 RepID=UPI002100BFE5|nr:uncharacterized protein LOC119458592 isoform X3 [Dermacentor silvarum]